MASTCTFIPENEKSMFASAMELLKATEKIDWSYLSMNPSAMDLLKGHPEKIDWSCFINSEKLRKKNYYIVSMTIVRI
jgi:hypothetical protein